MRLILKTGSTRPGVKSKHGDFEHWISNKMELGQNEYEVFKSKDYGSAPNGRNYSSIIITGSPAMVTEVKPKGSNLCNWLIDKQDKGIPILGICYGHQLLSHINDGIVSYNTEGLVFGLQKTHLTDAGKKDELLRTLPAKFDVYKAHRQVVSELPGKATVLAKSSSGRIDVFRIKNTWGVQFHPEFDKSISESYLDEQEHIFMAEGLDVDQVKQKLISVRYGDLILKEFKKFSDKYRSDHIS